jgi:hypothetical protein
MTEFTTETKTGAAPKRDRAGDQVNQIFKSVFPVQVSGVFSGSGTVTGSGFVTALDPFSTLDPFSALGPFTASGAFLAPFFDPVEAAFLGLDNSGSSSGSSESSGS